MPVDRSDVNRDWQEYCHQPLGKPDAKPAAWAGRHLRELKAHDPHRHADVVRLAVLDRVIACTMAGSPEHERALTEALPLRKRVRGY